MKSSITCLILEIWLLANNLDLLANDLLTIKLNTGRFLLTWSRASTWELFSRFWPKHTTSGHSPVKEKYACRCVRRLQHKIFYQLQWALRNTIYNSYRNHRCAGMYLVSEKQASIVFWKETSELGHHWFRQWCATFVLSNPLPEPTLVILSTHLGQVTHICISKLTITGSDNGLSSGPHQATIWTNAGILLNGPMGTKLRRLVTK